MNWKRLVANISIAAVFVAISIYVGWQVSIHVAESLVQCQIPCEVGPPGIDAWGMLKIMIFCAGTAFGGASIVDLARRHGWIELPDQTNGPEKSNELAEGL